jgi:hypothetical protein
MTHEQLSLFTDEELGLQGPKEIPKTVAIQLEELREQLAKDIEAASHRYVELTPVEERQEAFLCGLGVFVTCAAIVRGHF